MKLIQLLSEKIEEELEDACSYIDEALQYKSEDKATADLFYQLSLEEMGHMEKLHARVAAVITAYKAANGDPPPEMQWRYDYLHKQHMDEALAIKVKQGIYKEESK